MILKLWRETCKDMASMAQEKIMILAPATRLSRNPAILHAAADNGTGVMMSIEAGHYYGLDDIGFRIWALLEQPLTIAELTGRLGEEFDVDAETCRADVLDFVATLIAQRLVHASPA